MFIVLIVISPKNRVYQPWKTDHSNLFIDQRATLIFLNFEVATFTLNFHSNDIVILALFQFFFFSFLGSKNERKSNHYLPIIMLTTSFIFAPFPTCPKKKDFFPKTSKAGTASSYNA